MPNKEIEKQYSELRKKHRIPEFGEIDMEFEISDIEDTNFPLRAVMRRMAEKLDFYTTMLEEVLQPDTSSLYAMHEMKFFDDREKSRMYGVYAKLMSLNRQSIEASLERDEKSEADFISNALHDWKSLKAELLKFVKKMRASWNTEEADIKEDLGYLG
jgi:hypothetical protein